MATNVPIFGRGDRVWVRVTQRGGYGFAKDVSAVFARYTLQRCWILVALPARAGLSARLKAINVSPINVRRRPEDRVALVDELYSAGEVAR